MSLLIDARTGSGKGECLFRFKRKRGALLTRTGRNRTFRMEGEERTSGASIRCGTKNQGVEPVLLIRGGEGE